MKLFFLQHDKKTLRPADDFVIAKKTSQFVSGFTLVEALVATSILAVSITALLNIVGQNVFVSNYVKNKTTAISLAQEGIELTRNIQDSALLVQDFSSFNQFLGENFQPCIFGSGVCVIDPLDLQIQACSGEQCPPLKVSSNGYFNYDIEDTSNSFNEVFTRTFIIQPTGPSSGRVTVRVSWQQGQAERSVEYETDLFPWIN